jgi:hypothetical protein
MRGAWECDEWSAIGVGTLFRVLRCWCDRIRVIRSDGARSDRNLRGAKNRCRSAADARSMGVRRMERDRSGDDGPSAAVCPMRRVSSLLRYRVLASQKPFAATLAASSACCSRGSIACCTDHACCRLCSAPSERCSVACDCCCAAVTVCARPLFVTEFRCRCTAYSQPQLCHSVHDHDYNTSLQNASDRCSASWSVDLHCAVQLSERMERSEEFGAIMVDRDRNGSRIFRTRSSTCIVDEEWQKRCDPRRDSNPVLHEESLQPCWLYIVEPLARLIKNPVGFSILIASPWVYKREWIHTVSALRYSA